MHLLIVIKYTHIPDIGIMVRVFVNGPGNLGSIPGHVISKTQKLYLIPLCLTLSIIRYVSRVKWSNPGKGVVSSPTPWCSSYRKGRLRVTLDYGRRLYLLKLQNRLKSTKYILVSPSPSPLSFSLPHTHTHTLYLSLSLSLSLTFLLSLYRSFFCLTFSLLSFSLFRVLFSTLSTSLCLCLSMVLSCISLTI